MYYWYIGHRGRDWKPDEKCVVVCSLYGDLENGDVVHPAGRFTAIFPITG